MLKGRRVNCPKRPLGASVPEATGHIQICFGGLALPKRFALPAFKLSQTRIGAVMRAMIALPIAIVMSGCALFQGAAPDCQDASRALRAHDAKIEAARSRDTTQFTVHLASKGHAMYHCTQSRDHVACRAQPVAQPAISARLMHQRDILEARVARACQI